MSFPHSIFLFFLLLSITEAQPRTSNITLGSSLTRTATSSWSSPSALFSFGFFRQNTNATAVGIFLPDKTVVWTANRDNPTVSNDVVSLQLTTDGRLVLRRRQGGQDVNLISTSAPIASASMLDSGNFVLYNSDSRIIWQSFDYPTNTLLPGQRLSPPNELFSSASETYYGRGFFRLKMQNDATLVQYPVNTPDTVSYAYYSSGTTDAGSNVSLNLDRDGRLYLLNGTAFLKNITLGGLPTQGSLSLARLDVGGIFRLYSLSLNPLGNLTERWSSVTDKCEPKGLCGFNAFCTLMSDGMPECQCLPGFDFLHPGNSTAGCSRSFSAQVCPKIDNGDKYEMRPVENSVWLDNSYEVFRTPTREDCSKACLDDCNCEAAFFNDNQQCKKQRLPLTYGKKAPKVSDVALIRVGSAVGVGVPNTERVQNERRRRLDIFIVGIALMFMGVLALSFSAILIYRKKRKNHTKVGNHGGDDNNSLVDDISLQAFTFAYLSEATNNFKEELGRGGSGVVYKGFLQNKGKVVAVKKLEREFAQGEREFQTELKTIGKTYHRNLVRLLGYCIDGANKLLVLEYMSNGSLADVLFKPENRPIWEERINIARDISRGILYLHQECETQIIHCDIKPQNILMDENWCAKISDFGLAKLLKQDQTNTYTGIRGTKGYVAPEWYQNQAITAKADVYSFGVMLLEIICCRRCVDWRLSEEEAILEDWVYDCYKKGKAGDVVGEERERESGREKGGEDGENWDMVCTARAIAAPNDEESFAHVGGNCGYSVTSMSNLILEFCLRRYVNSLAN